VVGKTLRSAKTALLNHACRLGKVSHAFSKAKEGKVIAQSPKPGADRAENAKVNVTISKGPKPTPKHRPKHKPKHVRLF
jgi:eukaryotic-like serine/threonine-protein kinase